MMRASESGNVFFYIFIAVGLFAALSFAIAQGNRGAVGTLTADRINLYATEILEYSEAMGHAVSQLRLRGVAETEISFENNVVSGYTNANCTEGRCKIFDPAGGGIVYKAPPEDWLDTSQSAQAGYGTYLFSGRGCIPFVGDGGVSPQCSVDGIDNEDLLMFLPYVKKDICVELNDKLDMTNPSGDPPQDPGSSFNYAAHKFTGAFSDGLAVGGSTGDGPNINGKISGCFEGSVLPAGGTYHYYQVLLPR